MKQWILRGMTLLGIAAAVVGGPAYIQASGSYALTDSDFFNVQGEIVQQTQSSPLFLKFYFNDHGISFDDRRFRQYNAVTFYVGAEGSYSVDTASQVQVLGDGHVIKSIPLTSASPSPHITVRIAGHQIITFQRVSANDLGSGYFYVAAPTLVHLGPTPPPAPMIVLGSSSVKGGDQQTVDVATQANRLVTILIVYANGRHVVVGPQRSGPTGHDIYTFNVPSGVAGVAQIVAIVNGSGVAQTQFTVF